VSRRYDETLTEMHDLLDDIRSSYPVIDSIGDCLREAIASGSPFIDRLNEFLLSTSGKRIRPMLVVLAATLGEVDPRVLVDVASAVELVHLASLVHDDVIDESCLRRGKPTVSDQWGNLIAVLCGDCLFASAFGLLTKHRQHFVLRVLADTVRDMCEGEIEQALCAKSGEVDERAYFSHIEKKTARLMASCCKIGAYLAGASEEQMNEMQEYGLNLGYAFQIIDDLLDICGDEKSTGKPAWLDLRKGLPTLPIIRLTKRGERGRVVLETIYQLRDSRDSRAYADTDVPLRIRNEMADIGVLAESFEEARGFAARAAERLEAVPLPQRARDHLTRLALAVIGQIRSIAPSLAEHCRPGSLHEVCFVQAGLEPAQTPESRTGQTH
jgi:heptaprenyl diphosphate synthase